MQRDFTAVAFLRQISIITKLLFFSGSVDKHRQTELLWRVIFCIFCFFLPLSGSVVHLQLSTRDSDFFLAFLMNGLKRLLLLLLPSSTVCTSSIPMITHKHTLFGLLLSSCLCFDSVSTISKIHLHNSPIYDSKNFNFEQSSESVSA